MSVSTALRVLWRRRQLERSCRWTQDTLRQHQQQAVAELRRFAVSRSPFYARVHRGLEDRPLTELPVLTKAAMMEHFDDLVTDRRVRLADADAFLRSETDGLFLDRYVVLSTSGSTGRRGIFLFDPDEWLTAMASIVRPIAWAGITGRRRTAMIASTTAWHYSARIGKSLTSRLMPGLRLDAAAPFDTIVERLNAWQPDVLAVYPSILRQLADAQLAGALRLRLRGIATSAEVLPADTRRLARDAWAVPVYDTYGATEYSPIAAECAFGRKHLFEDGAIVEVVDERGRAVPPGHAGDRVLVTVFNRRTQPLIRYELSDRVRPIDGACDCGRPFALIDAIEGRVEETLHFPARIGGGTVAIHPKAFDELLDRVPATGWQVQRTGDGVTIALTGASERICGDLAARARAMFDAQGAHVRRVDVRCVDTLRRGATGKAPLILTTR